MMRPGSPTNSQTSESSESVTSELNAIYDCFHHRIHQDLISVLQSEMDSKFTESLRSFILKSLPSPIAPMNVQFQVTETMKEALDDIILPAIDALIQKKLADAFQIQLDKHVDGLEDQITTIVRREINSKLDILNFAEMPWKSASKYHVSPSLLVGKHRTTQSTTRTKLMIDEKLLQRHAALINNTPVARTARSDGGLNSPANGSVNGFVSGTTSRVNSPSPAVSPATKPVTPVACPELLATKEAFKSSPEFAFPEMKESKENTRPIIPSTHKSTPIIKRESHIMSSPLSELSLLDGSEMSNPWEVTSFVEDEDLVEFDD